MSGSLVVDVRRRSRGRGSITSAQLLLFPRLVSDVQDGVDVTLIDVGDEATGFRGGDRDEFHAASASLTRWRARVAGAGGNCDQIEQF